MEFSDVVLRIVKEFTKNHMNTSIPAKVINIDNFSEQQTVDVLPIINNTFDDGTVLEIPPILDVPVVFPSAGGGLLSFPVAVDDTVLLIFSKRSIDDWMASRKSDRGTFTPTDKRYYSLNDAIAIPGLYTKNTHLKPNATDVELKFAGSSIKLQADGDVIVSAAKDGIVTAVGNATVDCVDATITATGKISLNATGDIDISAGGNVNITGTAINLN